MGLVALQVAALLWLMVPATRSIPTREAKSATRERHAFQNGWLRPAALCGLGMLIGWKAGPLAEMQADRLLHIEIPRIGMVKAASLPEGTSDIFQAVSAVREEMSRQRALLDALHSSLDSLGHRLAAKEQPAQEMSGPDKLRPREQTAAEAQPPRSSAIGFCSADTSRTLVLPFDRYEEKLSERHRASLEDEIASLPCPPRGIRINGYTDNRGTPEQNERLSRQRAALVAELLRDKGVRTDRLEIHALGARNAIADNDTVDGRARNRRVEVVFEF
jgi:outer membrane protein OmpA-like peptidoglycan-associated protein